jgi:hypothetical protein
MYVTNALKYIHICAMCNIYDITFLHEYVSIRV